VITFRHCLRIDRLLWVVVVIAVSTVPPALADWEAVSRRVDARITNPALKDGVRVAILAGVGYLLTEEAGRGRVHQRIGGSQREVSHLCAIALRHAGTLKAARCADRLWKTACSSGAFTAQAARDVYDVALFGMGAQLMEADARRCAVTATALSKSQEHRNGYWGYRLGIAPRATPDFPNLSTTLFAALGLAALSRTGHEPRTSTWEELLRGLLRQQTPSGSWGYRAMSSDDGPGVQPVLARRPGYPAGTFQGMAVLQIADTLCHRQQDQLRRKVRRAKRRGVSALKADVPEYLRSFRDDDSSGSGGGSHGWSYYGLYCLGLACSYANLGTVGGRDWYVEVCQGLVRTQRPDGGWGVRRSAHASQPDSVSTAFALLFLCRAFDVTHPTTPASLDSRSSHPVTPGAK
jgi:Prenyltransferase and squalene oxidase repeat